MTNHPEFRDFPATYIETKDGDTVWVMVDMGFRHYQKIDIRLSVVDTPEKNEPGWAEATAFTKAWMENNKELTVRATKDKRNEEKEGGFGRWLGEFISTTTGESLNKLLLDNKLAKVYTRK